jgi:cell wall assembly regulator SMI1
MKAIWKRIHTWLNANAQAGYGSLRVGASGGAIGAAEKAMGLKLPADVKASYRIHDGQDNEPGLIGGEGWQVLSLKEMVQVWGRWSQASSKRARFVPLAWNAMGDFVFLNLDPGSEQTGSLMIQRHDRRKPDPLASSFRSWLEDFADHLEEGELVYSEEDGELMYADELDLE